MDELKLFLSYKCGDLKVESDPTGLDFEISTSSPYTPTLSQYLDLKDAVELRNMLNIWIKAKNCKHENYQYTVNHEWKQCVDCGETFK